MFLTYLALDSSISMNGFSWQLMLILTPKEVQIGYQRFCYSTRDGLIANGDHVIGPKTPFSIFIGEEAYKDLIQKQNDVVWKKRTEAKFKIWCLETTHIPETAEEILDFLSIIE